MTAPWLAPVVLGWLLALRTPWYPAGRAPETRAEYEARLGTIAAAVDLETRELPDGWGWGRRELAAALATLAWYESGLSRAIHDGSRLGDAGRSYCLVQVMCGRRSERGRSYTGTTLDATRRCMRAGAEKLGLHWRRCVPRGAPVREHLAARVLTGYGTGRTCAPGHRRWPLDRARMWARLLARR